MKTFYDHHGFDEFEFDDDDDDDYQTGRRRVCCNRCGSTAVRWRQQGGKWVLFSPQPGVVHVCEPSAAGFEDLTK